ncbi:hypothetical protein EMIT036CA2_40136 [Chryseobacterium sp. IT-36CA2]
MFDYGWRQYIPELGRWNGIDQLAESYLSTSTYAYVANNPISNTDPDGRWIYEDGSMGLPPATFDLHGSQYKPTMSFSTYDGMHYNEGGGSYTPFGNTQTYADLMAAWRNGGTFGLTNSNGTMKWWTDIPDSYDEEGNFVKGVGGFNILKFVNNGLIGLTNDIESASNSLMKYQTEDFFKDSEKHLNGQLGNANMIIDEYNKLSNINKINASTFLSAVSGIRAGKILRSTEGFMKSVGKVEKRLYARFEKMKASVSLEHSIIFLTIEALGSYFQGIFYLL